MNKKQQKQKIWDASKIKQFRLDAGFKQNDAGKGLGIAPEWLSSIENGHEFASNDLICRMADLYGKRIFEFAYDKFVK